MFELFLVGASRIRDPDPVFKILNLLDPDPEQVPAENGPDPQPCRAHNQIWPCANLLTFYLERPMHGKICTKVTMRTYSFQSSVADPDSFYRIREFFCNLGPDSGKNTFF